MRLAVNEVLRAVDARLPIGAPDTTFEGAFVDSRAPVEGALFVGVRGDTTDGGQHAPDALYDGAAAAVVTESAWRWIEGDVLSMRKPVIVAADPVAVLQAAGRLALARCGARVVGITGATGKTTTKDILVAMLTAAGVRAVGNPGNLNTEVGVPMGLLALPEDTEVAVVEMGMRGPGQIAALAALAPPSVACITAIGPVHLELLGTVENVAAAKAEIIAALGPDGVAVVPEDEPLLAPYVARLDPSVRVLTFDDEPRVTLDLSLTKSWERRNAAAAAACCEGLGVALPSGLRVAPELSDLRGQEDDLAGGGRLIEDCYNANPLAMTAALEDLASRPGRRVAVLGDMMELGPEEAVYHRSVGQVAGRLGIDTVIAVGARARDYLGAGVAAELHFPTVEEAVAGVPAAIADGDVVLVKGSRSLRLERVADALRAREAGCPAS